MITDKLKFSTVRAVTVTRKVCVRIYFCRRRTDGPETEWSFQGKYPKSRYPVDDQLVIHHKDLPRRQGGPARVEIHLFVLIHPIISDIMNIRNLLLSRDHL